MNEVQQDTGTSEKPIAKLNGRPRLDFRELRKLARDELNIMNEAMAVDTAEAEEMSETALCRLEKICETISMCKSRDLADLKSKVQIYAMVAPETDDAYDAPIDERLLSSIIDDINSMT